MYNDKPVIIAEVPWWRHHVLPWGWYMLASIKVPTVELIEADGQCKPGDGGGGIFVFVKDPAANVYRACRW